MDNSAPDINELLVRYLDGELDEPERITVKEKLAADDELNSSYNNLLLARQAVLHYGLKEKVKHIHGQMIAELHPPVSKGRVVNKMVRYTMAIAASLVLIVAGWLAYSFYSLSPDRIFSSNYHPYELSNTRGNTQESSGIEKAYEEKRFRDVVTISRKTRTKDQEEMFLTANAWLQLKNTDSAIKNYKDVLALNQKTKVSLLNDEAEYYLALTYILDKDYDFALVLLRKIKNDPAHTYNGSVTAKMIRQIKMLKWR